MILEFGPEAPWILHALAAAALVLHIGGGAMGILSGFTAMVAAKGGRLHRLSGTVFCIAMLTMAGVAAIVAPMLPDGRWTNTTAAIVTLYLVATAWLTVRRPAGRLGGFERAAAVVPLGVAAMGLVLIPYGAWTGRMDGFATVYIFAAICGLAAACDLADDPPGRDRRDGPRGASSLAHGRGPVRRQRLVLLRSAGPDTARHPRELRPHRRRPRTPGADGVLVDPNADAARPQAPPRAP